MTILIALLIFLVIYVIVQYNSFTKKKLEVEQTRKAIDIYLKQRFDLIPNLVETVKGLKNHEQSVLENLTKLRTKAHEQNSMQEKANLNNEYNNILLTVEAYPELKSNEAFLNLQKQLSKMESQLQASRRIYNMEVTGYNTKREKFPTNIIAGVFGFEEEKLFEIGVEERQNVDVKID